MSTFLNSPNKFVQPLWIKIALVVLLLLLIGFGAVPGYLNGTWSWDKPPNIQNLSQIKAIREEGIALDNWKIVEQQKVKIGGHEWSAQFIQQEKEKPVLLLLLPQKDHRDQPEVEWMDVNGWVKRIQQQRQLTWNTDSYETLKVTISPEATVNARFFRAWTQQETFAILQWYAWPNGGHPSPFQWFMADQGAQLKGQRVPWIAVYLQMPIEPLAELDTVRQEALLMVETVQATLMQTAFSSK
ncbi:MAG: cyanoexosortase B system-associated protein [Chroococcales cyanobacterium]